MSTSTFGLGKRLYLEFSSVMLPAPSPYNVDKLPFLSNGLTDRHKIWHGGAH